LLTEFEEGWRVIRVLRRHGGIVLRPGPAARCQAPCRLRRALIVAGLLAAALAAPAGAHVQVRPALAAPGDPVLFQVIVPGERDAKTVEVTLQIPEDVLPFSWEATPGWARTIKEAPDGTVDTVTWRGELAEDGFARFSFLASTPEQEGEIAWKSLQTYDDGTIVRWIGAPDSDNPAAVTRISAGAPRENAGGEGGAAESPQPGATAAPTAAAATAPTDDDSPLPLILGLVAVVLAAAALAVALRGGTRLR
jgi:uncharacterized protein YcnI